ncbi:hypothetical protein [Rhodospirillum rubrum]|uniref:Polysaccharide biosynthesis protein n=1 Tax=Rhodospirillum rubrum (strain ATCC 11170 / ATH 1.1.1 / DSM 467 / LMG 4362 / NCIMB 8255 / S1) TaxID=269796 RepID=Q2RUB3_RHORT|nr:hypothetical protein [Rhodospirillum rubrum]ABC22282.1 hypothetical protein Rru_A1481 [Rhodospirillum rubrum ATCC 11170]AEO48000.1 hypothetical protein F11_07650 [Rhodospirillum rubrum F11]MBK5953850.1 hypothetical protein [Rhodospirillum rubrum]QXG81923.1 hypothetical protein KUL73_07675 [Rhodospirillum rubrum]HAP99848.1 hypothetical protein [Rhodospirillum rubrum]
MTLIPPLRRSGLAGRALHPAGPIAVQIFGQGVNFLSQTALLAVFGAAFYGPVGLALVAAATLCFLGELGYPVVLLSAVARDDDWPRHWRIALFQRVMVLGGGTPCALGLWAWIYGIESEGWGALAAAAPGIIASAWQPAPLLYGQGRAQAAALSVYGRWGVFGLGMTLVLILGVPSDWAVGLVFSAGMIAPLLFWPWLGLDAVLLRPLVSRRLGRLGSGALGWWVMSLVGTLNDRGLPFVIEATRPAILAHALLALQVLQGLTALAGQFDRLLVPWLIGRLKAPGWARDLAKVQGGVLSIALGVAALLVAILALAAPMAERGALSWFLAEWALVLCGGAFTAAILAKGRERPFARRLTMLVIIGVIAQAGVVLADGPFAAVMIVRLVVAGLCVVVALRLLGLSAPREAWFLAAGGAACVALANATPAAAPLIGLGLGLAGLGLWRGWKACRHIDRGESKG